MRIGFDFRMGGSINSGIGRYVFELLKQVLKNDGQNEYFIFYNKYNVDGEDLNKLKNFQQVTLIPTNVRHYSLMEQLLLPKILNKYRLDLIHFPNFNVPIFYKGKFVVTIHDMVHHKISGHKKSNWLHFQAYKYIIKKSAQRSEKIITVTNYARCEIIKYLRVPEDKIEVIYEAVSLEPVPQAYVEKVKQLLLLRRPYFIFVGTLERKKNIVTLAQGFDRFLDTTRLDMDLVIAGKADKHYPNIKHDALKIKHRDRVVFTDYVENDMLSALYQGAYAFVTASLHEGFGIPGVEAMRFGLPVLASNTEVFNEVYDNAAMYFDPMDPDDIADKMNIIARDVQFRGVMQEKGLTRSSLFDWTDAAQKTLKLYKIIFDAKKE